jgi:bifunctional non-homologous end joining protein LigD
MGDNCAAYFKSSEGVPLVYYVFDLLFLEGKDLRSQPLSARRKLLAQLLKKPPVNIRLSDELLRVAHESGLEGLVAKKTQFSLRKRPTKWRLGQIQDHQVSGICDRRLHAA